MYEYIKGILVSIEPTYIVIEQQEIGYKVYVANPFRWSSQLNHHTTLYLEQIIREDAHMLYGFGDLSEKHLFNRLTTVKGIGPKIALSILAPGDHQGLIDAIESNDIKYLTHFPGVGKKTAQQMVLDLQGKLEDLQDDRTAVVAKPTADETILSQTQEALLGLGYSKREVDRVVKQMQNQTFDDTQTALSQALSLLLK